MTDDRRRPRDGAPAGSRSPPGRSRSPRRSSVSRRARSEPLVAALLEVGRVDRVVDVLDTRRGRSSGSRSASRARAADPTFDRSPLDLHGQDRGLNRIRRMEHPRDRSGFSRRQLAPSGGRLRGGARRGRSARRLREHDDADRRRRRRPDRRGREARRPEADSAPAACRCRAPTTRSPGRSPRQQADRRRPPGRARPAQRLQLRRLHRPGAVKRFEKQFNTSVQIATYNSSDEAIAKLASGAVALRRDHRPDRRRTSST